MRLVVFLIVLPHDHPVCHGTQTPATYISMHQRFQRSSPQSQTHPTMFLETCAAAPGPETHSKANQVGLPFPSVDPHHITSSSIQALRMKLDMLMDICASETRMI